jgi:methylphosphotriester-DNA--protein-cysteine methyltransferase
LKTSGTYLTTIIGFRAIGDMELHRTFEAQAGLLMADFLPYLTARKAASARDRLMAAFRAYIAAGYENGDDVSDFIKDINRVQREWGSVVI